MGSGFPWARAVAIGRARATSVAGGSEPVEEAISNDSRTTKNKCSTRGLVAGAEHRR
jgi:hypothetical protein